MSLQTQVSFSLEEKERAAVFASICELEKVIKDKLVLLDPETRRDLLKMGDKSIGFVSKAIEYAESSPDLVPKYVDTEEMKKDFSAVSTLREISSKLAELQEMVGDTMTLSGSEALNAALAFYNALKGAARARQPGAQIIYDDLKSRFPRGSNQATNVAESE